ncbi:MAG: sugar ABC transporter permease [Clostridia bacterium]|nr:sugar ABC transporter permease [Clostridia bacterium]
MSSIGRTKGMSLSRKQNLTGWVFLSIAAIMIVWMNFYPMVRALLLSFQSGQGARMSYAGIRNYEYLIKDPIFRQALINNFLFLIIQVPVMLVLALILATMLNDRSLRLRGVFRTAIFLPCATSLVSYAIVFRALFSVDGFVNTILLNAGIIDTAINWLNEAGTARFVVIIALIWRWTGYNMVFYLSGLQNIDHSIYEAARIDGANHFQQFTRITAPLLKPIILLTAILSTNGTLQLFDESFNLTRGGPANMTITMSHYIYKTSFEGVPRFGYSAAMSYVIFLLVAILAFCQMKVGDKR